MTAGSPALTRRLFLASAVAAAVAPAQKPESSSFDLSLLDQPATPNDLFFVREHFPTPERHGRRLDADRGRSRCRALRDSFRRSGRTATKGARR